MNIELVNGLINEVATQYSQREKVYLKNVNGDAEVVDVQPADDDLIATVYPVDALHPGSIVNVTGDENKYINGRPLVVYCKGTTMYDFSIPLEYQMNPPYTGRPFIHRKWDCFTLLRDYYKRELNIDMPPVEYFDEWWNKGENFYLNTSGVAGFYPVTSLQKHDVIAMRLGSHVFNHSAIYLGDNKILHHVGGKFSCIETIRPAYMRMMFGYFRHKDLAVQNG